MQTTMTPAAAVVSVMPAVAAIAESECGGARNLRTQRFALRGRNVYNPEKIGAPAFSLYSPPARSTGGIQEVVHGSSNSSSLKVSSSMVKSVVESENEDEEPLPTSALAIAATAASLSSARFEFLTKIGDPGRLVSTPSGEFLALCAEQLSLCEKIVGIQTNLTVRL
jgi:hypothetical protein